MAVIEQNPIDNFFYALKSSESRRQYPKRFEKFLNFLGLDGSLEDKSKAFLLDFGTVLNRSILQAVREVGTVRSMDSLDRFRERMVGILDKAEENAPGDEVTGIRALRMDFDKALDEVKNKEDFQALLDRIRRHNEEEFQKSSRREEV